MDAATLYMIVMFQGKEREASKHFPSVTACEDFVTQWRRHTTDMQVLRYECKALKRFVATDK
jgi:hypothetical protein